jgi:drug/metabolite transporter (DMT)-like permease
LLANFQVFFMMLAGLCLLGEKPRPIQIVAVPLALLGLALIVGLDWQSLPENYRLGVVFGLLTAVAYAGYLLTMREARTNTVYRLPAREVAVISIGSAALLAVSSMVEGQSLSIPTYADAAWLIAYGILSNCLGLLFIASSLPQVSAAEAGLALLLQPTLSFVWDVLFFARALTAIELTGAVITLIAIYLGSRPASKQVQGAG